MKPKHKIRHYFNYSADTSKASCPYCNWTTVGNATRQFTHLVTCNQVPEEVREQVKTLKKPAELEEIISKASAKRSKNKSNSTSIGPEPEIQIDIQEKTSPNSSHLLDSISNKEQKAILQIQRCWDSIKTKKGKQYALRIAGGSPLKGPETDSNIEWLNTNDIEQDIVIDNDSTVNTQVETSPLTDNFIVDGEVLIKMNGQGVEGDETPRKRPAVRIGPISYKKIKESGVPAEVTKRLNHADVVTGQEKEIFDLRKKEAEVRLEIARMELEMFKMKKEAMNEILKNQISLSKTSDFKIL